MPTEELHRSFQSQSLDAPPLRVPKSRAFFRVIHRRSEPSTAVRLAGGPPSKTARRYTVNEDGRATAEHQQTWTACAPRSALGVLTRVRGRRRCRLSYVRPYRSLQLGLSGEAARRYADEWTVTIRDMTPLAHEIHTLVRSGNLDSAARLLPEERPYTAANELLTHLRP
ncbi:DUF4291 family protein [Streptomyces sp. NBC_00191]|uniref:DUF4291 family protein n=1 Tax=Streptomyces sp. NBC_00191 TaxID=2975674 RepID=UPI0038681979